MTTSMRDLMEIVSGHEIPVVSEAVAAHAALYHGTSLPRLVRIMQGDRLTPDDNYQQSSLTRSYAIAAKFATTRTLVDIDEMREHRLYLDEPEDGGYAPDALIRCIPKPSGQTGAILVFDRGKLTQRHRLRPHDDGAKVIDPTFSEAEERILGRAKGISRALTSIVIQNPVELATFQQRALRQFPEMAAILTKIDSFAAEGRA